MGKRALAVLEHKVPAQYDKSGDHSFCMLDYAKSYACMQAGKPASIFTQKSSPGASQAMTDASLRLVMIWCL
ncbi:hypothetical protein DUNSADRAFT_15741 [Dunaliella salina]|uniref:Encoded protein n=1 Tax=Dunaliella salina TaxID=3046 RepID=A0ABQ7H9B5_DUNSA|nr:hypothetical protein DUNSADRAFT_15741 [Dunaliella salina]|eukprot:KAF5843446.1 hypothetical protein DUNSADRAFT_15741 [Dunaliella salina]